VITAPPPRRRGRLWLACGRGRDGRGAGDKIIELYEAVEAASQRATAGEVVAPEDHAPVLGENRLLQPLDEAVGPGMARLDARLADAQRRTGGGEVGLELIAAVRQHPRQRPTGTLDRRHQDVAQKGGGGLRRERRQDARHPVRTRRVTRGDLPHLADSL